MKSSQKIKSKSDHADFAIDHFWCMHDDNNTLSLWLVSYFRFVYSKLQKRRNRRECPMRKVGLKWHARVVVFDPWDRRNSKRRQSNSSYSIFTNSNRKSKSKIVSVFICVFSDVFFIFVLVSLLSFNYWLHRCWCTFEYGNTAFCTICTVFFACFFLFCLFFLFSINYCWPLYFRLLTIAELAVLRQKFEEDKKRIAQLRAARKFKPY